MECPVGGRPAGLTTKPIPCECPGMAQPIRYGNQPSRRIVGATDRPPHTVDDVRDESARVPFPCERPDVRAHPRHRVRQPVAPVVRKRLSNKRVGGREEVADEIVREGFGIGESRTPQSATTMANDSKIAITFFIFPSS